MRLTLPGALAIALPVALTGVVLPGLAVPANANPALLNGTYAIDGGEEGLVATVASNCATEGCTASIASNVGWTSTATMTGGRWNFTVSKPDGVVCQDGSYAPVTMHYSVDPVSLSGTLLADSNGDCPGGQVTRVPFWLTKVG